MKKHYFLGAAAGYSRGEVWRHVFAIGREKDRRELKKYLEKRYSGEAILCKNGRSALALALKAYFKPGDAVIVNGFTCYAVHEAVKAAGLKPVWADISKDDLNLNLNLVSSVRDKPSGIIIQNTLGNPIDIKAVEKFAKKHNLVIIEDLAHCAGVRYADGREAGTVGAACALSFGKDKSIDTVSGGAVVLRTGAFTGPRGASGRPVATGGRRYFSPCQAPDPLRLSKSFPYKRPRISDHLRARFYPMFGAIYRRLSYVHLNGVWMRCLIAIHWVERSADNRLDLTRKISRFEAKLALRQFGKLKKTGEPPLREFYLVRDRDEVLKQLAAAGYYFGGFWYERPVSPERYYKKVHFPEATCPVAMEVARQIINLPNYYTKQELAPARKIIAKYMINADSQNEGGEEVR